MPYKDPAKNREWHKDKMRLTRDAERRKSEIAAKLEFCKSVLSQWEEWKSRLDSAHFEFSSEIGNMLASMEADARKTIAELEKELSDEKQPQDS